MASIHRGILAATLCAALSCASASPDQSSEVDPPPPLTLTNAKGENQQWSGVGRLTLPANKQCIASLIDTSNDRQYLDGAAYAVTSGHCVEQRHGVIVQNQPIVASISFNYFVDTLDQRHTVPVKRVVWSSMQGIDLALLELDVTLGQAMAEGIVPLQIGLSPAPGSAVQVVGEPSAPDQGVRLSRCSEERADVVVEHPWVWRHVRRNGCTGMTDGASGSAVVDAASGKLVSVVNSVIVTRPGSASCSLNQPCHPTDDAATTKPLRNVAMPVQRLLGCFNAGRAELSQEDCGLLPAFQLEQRTSPRAANKIAMSAEGQQTLPSWGLTFTLDTPRYRYKATRDALACEDPVGYSGTLSATQDSIDDPFGPEPGWHFLCLIGVASPEQTPTPGLMANSLSIPARLLPAGLPQPALTIEPTANGDIDITWHLDPPDLILYRVKRGAPGEVDCDDPAGYRALARTRQRIAAAQLPLTLCTKAFDLLKQSSPPRIDLLESAVR
ncbi:trypsin-like peptidase domain-containing protein [Pseudomonas sichuanensis]|uniref:Trypsin-like peptidase domain-containing protein n=1 Tax=Pseudomonas sichuanensis TaxID=2213015 RepID=A0ABV0DIF8_9PSED